MVCVKRGRFLAFVTGFFAVTLSGQATYAQVRAHRGSSAYSRFGTIGVTEVSQGLNLYRDALGGGTRPGDVSAGNYVGQGLGPAAQFAQSRRMNPLAALRPPALGIRDVFANPLNTGLAFGAYGNVRDYTGRETWARANTRPVSTGYEPGALYMSLQAPQVLLGRNAFFAPVRDADKGGHIRDDLTNRTLRNMPDEVPTRMDTTLDRPSYASMMADRLQAKNRERLEDAWGHFSEGRFQQAANTFRTLTNWRDNELESTLGLLVAELVSEQFQTAMATMQRLVSGSAAQRSVVPGGDAQRVNPFRCDLDLRRRNPSRPDESASAASAPAQPSSSDAPWSEKKLETMLQELSFASQGMLVEQGMDASQSTSAARISAAYVVMLWYSGKPTEALRVADEVRTKYSDTPFARMASDIREAMAADKIGQPTVAATP